MNVFGTVVRRLKEAAIGAVVGGVCFGILIPILGGAMFLIVTPFWWDSIPVYQLAGLGAFVGSHGGFVFGLCGAGDEARELWRSFRTGPSDTA